MNSESSKTSEPYSFALNLRDKIDLQGGDKLVVLTIRSQYPLHMEKHKKFLQKQ